MSSVIVWFDTEEIIRGILLWTFVIQYESFVLVKN